MEKSKWNIKRVRVERKSKKLSTTITTTIAITTMRYAQKKSKQIESRKSKKYYRCETDRDREHARTLNMKSTSVVSSVVFRLFFLERAHNTLLLHIQFSIIKFFSLFFLFFSTHLFTISHRLTINKLNLMALSLIDCFLHTGSLCRESLVRIQHFFPRIFDEGYHFLLP